MKLDSPLSFQLLDPSDQEITGVLRWALPVSPFIILRFLAVQVRNWGELISFFLEGS